MTQGREGTQYLVAQGRSAELNSLPLRVITLLLVAYVYDAVLDTFQQLPGMPAHIPLQIHNATRALQLIEEGEGGSC